MNVAAHSTGAVCCPSEVSARRHERRGWRATWVHPGGLYQHPTPGFASARTLTLVPAMRRWTR